MYLNHVINYYYYGCLLFHSNLQFNYNYSVTKQIPALKCTICHCPRLQHLISKLKPKIKVSSFFNSQYF